MNDEEMTQEIIHERMQILKKLYKGCENNFIIEQVKRLNLLENGKEFIEKLLYKKSLEGKCVEVLILAAQNTFLEYVLQYWQLPFNAL